MTVYVGPSEPPRKSNTPPCDGNPANPHTKTHRWESIGENRYVDDVWKCRDCGTVDID